MNTPGYESLAAVLQRAYDQAASGKGAERHADKRPFTEQPMQSISGLLGNDTGLLYQAMKKIQESQRMDKDAAIRELLGAINYIAGSIIFKEGGQDKQKIAAKLEAEIDRYRAASAGGAPLPPSSPWLCYHGVAEPTEPAVSVPVGEACPVCFATT